MGVIQAGEGLSSWARGPKKQIDCPRNKKPNKQRRLQTTDGQSVVSVSLLTERPGSLGWWRRCTSVGVGDGDVLWR
eukprot:13852928-Heterocapsa_arctica.AAC.1